MRIANTFLYECTKTRVHERTRRSRSCARRVVERWCRTAKIGRAKTWDVDGVEFKTIFSSFAAYGPAGLPRNLLGTELPICACVNRRGKGSEAAPAEGLGRDARAKGGEADDVRLQQARGIEGPRHDVGVDAVHRPPVDRVEHGGGQKVAHDALGGRVQGERAGAELRIAALRALHVHAVHIADDYKEPYAEGIYQG